MGAWLVGLALVAVAWKLLCAFLRRQRAKLLANVSDPHAINACIMSVEFPFLFLRSTEIGILRTFAIPSISSMLQKGGQYAYNTSKRYDDTEILLEEMLVHHLDSPRGSHAVRRLNFIHSHYAITNPDYLYVLCLGMVVPPEWAARYGYREWTELEKSSGYKAWHDIGTRMGLRDIPPSIEAAAKYIDDFEAKYMVYADSNHQIAELNMKLLLSEIPKPLQPLARRLAYALMDDGMRAALGYPKQPTWLSTLTHSLLKLHGVAVSWMPPRPFAWAQMRISMGCPAINNPDTKEGVLPLAFQRYKPVAYEKGYKISELGGHKHGQLANAFGGALLCPLQKSNTASLPWPDALLMSKRDVDVSKIS